MNLLHLQSLSDWGLLALRAGLAATFWVHGTQKLAMWKMQPSAQMPAPFLRLLRLLSIAEPLGAVAVLTGFLTPLAALGFAVVMLGAIRLKAVQMKKGFSGDGGWETDVLILAMSVALIILGPGGLSLDRVLFRS